MPDISGLTDLAATTIRNLPDNQWMIALNAAQYPGCRILEDERITSRGGTSIQKNIILNYSNGQAQVRTMFQQDNAIVPTGFNIINVPWTFFGVNYSWDVNELLMNLHDDEGFIDLIVSRRQMAKAQEADLLEQLVFGVPVSQGDVLNPFGIQYYLPFANNGVTAAGFTGQTIRYSNGTTGTICAGIDAAQFAKWNTYVGTYNKVDNQLLLAIRSAIRQTHFNFPKLVEDHGGLTEGIDSSHGLYVNNNIMGLLEDLLAKMGDAGGKAGLLRGVGVATDTEQKAYVTIDGIPLCYNPFQDNETAVNSAGAVVNPNSVLCVRWDALKPTVLEDMWMYETLPIADRGQHTALSVFEDSTWNIVVEDRRRSGFRLHNPL
jgi:hypothetical protein